MNWRERIDIDPKVLVGKPVVKGTRLAVEFIIDLLAQGWSEEQILANYSGLTRNDIHACLAYASDALRDERVYPLRGESAHIGGRELPQCRRYGSPESRARRGLGAN